MTEAEQLSEKVGTLKDAILSRHPTLPTLLREIHTTLMKYPEQVTLLSEQEISVIVSGLSVQTGITFAAAATKPAGVKSLAAKIKTLGADAF